MVSVKEHAGLYTPDPFQHSCVRSHFRLTLYIIYFLIQRDVRVRHGAPLLGLLCLLLGLGSSALCSHLQLVMKPLHERKDACFKSTRQTKWQPWWIRATMDWSSFHVCVPQTRACSSNARVFLKRARVPQTRVCKTQSSGGVTGERHTSTVLQLVSFPLYVTFILIL